ncbi:MAG TPA: GatB/YqeY domain-containing protein [Actinomycetota bacterium]|nr:GatB/YqeY domain-containing protein [Actinomycetota bacterium]
MGEVADRLSAQIKEALKAGDRTRLDTLRLLAAAVKNREIELGHDLTGDELVEVATREVKRRKEAAEAYEQAGRSELAEKERSEQALLETYLPAQLSSQEVEAAVDEAVAATGASGPKEMGKVIGHVMQRHKGRVDGNEVKRLVQARLSES